MGAGHWDFPPRSPVKGRQMVESCLSWDFAIWKLPRVAIKPSSWKATPLLNLQDAEGSYLPEPNATLVEAKCPIHVPSSMLGCGVSLLDLISLLWHSTVLTQIKCYRVQRTKLNQFHLTIRAVTETYFTRQ